MRTVGPRNRQRKEKKRSAAGHNRIVLLDQKLQALGNKVEELKRNGGDIGKIRKLNQEIAKRAQQRAKLARPL